MISIYIPPYSEPVSLAEMRLAMKCDSDVTTDDTLIASITTAARDKTETDTGSNVPRNKVMLATTFDLTLDTFPYWNYIEVPRVPLVSVTSITYVDSAGDTQTLASSTYAMNASENRIYLAYGQSWPDLRSSIEDKITVRFIAGMAASFSAATTDICTVSGRVFVNGDRVQVINSGGALPTGLAALTTYFVVEVSGSTLKLSLTSGGAAVDITGVGSGTNFIALDMLGFETLRNAVRFLATYWYNNRQAAVVGYDHATVLPLAYESLVAQQHA